MQTQASLKKTLISKLEELNENIKQNHEYDADQQIAALGEHELENRFNYIADRCAQRYPANEHDANLKLAFEIFINDWFGKKSVDHALM